MNKLDIRKIRRGAYRNGGNSKKDLRAYRTVRAYRKYVGNWNPPTIEKRWITKAGLLAVVVMTYLGHRCGYVLLDNIADRDLYLLNINVHGGVTYAEYNRSYPVRNKGSYVVGFDCNHYMDAAAPGSLNEKRYNSSGAVHRDLEFCIGQCELLASQL